MEYNLDEVDLVAEYLIRQLNTFTIWVLAGSMGSGKTTLAKAVCKQLGITATVSSPSYTLVNEYQGPRGIIYHFDFYRIKHETEAMDMGVEEYFDSGNLCLLEWAERIPHLLPATYATIQIDPIHNNTRKITLQQHVG